MKENTKIKKLKVTCFCCKKMHIVTGGCTVSKMFRKRIGKTVFIFHRYAPLFCYLKYHRKEVEDYFKELDEETKC